MIVAGIDEAGYGPMLGPLVVGACAFELPDDSQPLCLWKRLTRIVSKKGTKDGRKLHFNDSKIVYAPADGLKQLERSVLALAGCLHDWPDDLDKFLKCVAEHAIPELAEHQWYTRAMEEKFPIEVDGMSARIMANALRAEMERTATRCVYYAARVVSERPYNRLCTATRNKSNALFSIASIHLDALVRRFGHQKLEIFCDRQGGRAHYGPMLRQMFDDWHLEILEESDGCSRYRITQGEHAVPITFVEKAETQSMSVAAASMLCKYLREALMHRFNAWWRLHVPDLAPTAGYHGDGARFLEDIKAARATLGISDADLIRVR